MGFISTVKNWETSGSLELTSGPRELKIFEIFCVRGSDSWEISTTVKNWYINRFKKFDFLRPKTIRKLILVEKQDSKKLLQAP